MNEEYFMGIAWAVASGSQCKRAQVGAVIVDEQRRIVSTGFNGQPRGVDNNCEDCEGNTLPTVIHAEMNAILFASRPLTGCTMYVTHSPCSRCSAFIMQTGLKEVVYDIPYKQNSILTNARRIDRPHA